MLRRLIPKIYNAAASAEACSALLGELQRLFCARACGVVAFDFEARKGVLDSTIGVYPKFVSSYRDRYSRHDPWLRDEQPYRVPGTVHQGHELVPDAELMDTQFYREWLQPQELFYRLSVVLTREGKNLCYFAVLRGRSDPSFGLAEVRLCRTLAPHLRSAVQMRRQLAMLEVERNAALEVLDRLPTAVVLCDQAGVPVIVNGAARAILASNDGLAVQGGELAARTQFETYALKSLIVAAGRGEKPDGALAVSRASGARPLSVLVLPVQARAAIPGHRRITAAIFISDPESAMVANEERLEERLLQLYGLTRAESRMAAKIAQGRSLEEAAAMLNIRPETARGYIKRVLWKTGTKRQVDLVRLLLLSPAHLS